MMGRLRIYYANQIINQSFWDSFAGIGIVGAIIAIVIIAKSKRYKEMKKIAGEWKVIDVSIDDESWVQTINEKVKKEP